MFNTKLNIVICMLAIVAMAGGITTGESLLLDIGTSVQFIFAVMVAIAYLGGIAAANDVLDDAATPTDIERVITLARRDRSNDFVNMALFTGTGFLSLFAGGYLSAAMTLVALIMAAVLTKRAAKADRYATSKAPKQQPKVTTTSEAVRAVSPKTAAVAMGAASAAATTRTSAQDDIANPLHPLNPTNALYQAIAADSVSDHAVTRDCSSSYSSSSYDSGWSSYDSGSSCSSSSSSDSGSSSW